jgi:hypothetical protein
MVKMEIYSCEESGGSWPGVHGHQHEAFVRALMAKAAWVLC